MLPDHKVLRVLPVRPVLSVRKVPREKPVRWDRKGLPARPDLPVPKDRKAKPDPLGPKGRRAKPDPLVPKDRKAKPDPRGRLAVFWDSVISMR